MEEEKRKMPTMPEETRLFVAKRLRQIMDDKKFTQTNLADLLGVSRNTANNYYHGKTELPFYAAMLICEKLGCDMEYLYKEDRFNKEKEEFYYTADHKTVCDAIGLVPDAVDVLKKYPKGKEGFVDKEANKDFLELLSYLLVSNPEELNDLLFYLVRFCHYERISALTTKAQGASYSDGALYSVLASKYWELLSEAIKKYAKYAKNVKFDERSGSSKYFRNFNKFDKEKNEMLMLQIGGPEKKRQYSQKEVYEIMEALSMPYI